MEQQEKPSDIPSYVHAAWEKLKITERLSFIREVCEGTMEKQAPDPELLLTDEQQEKLATQTLTEPPILIQMSYWGMVSGTLGLDRGATLH